MLACTQPGRGPVGSAHDERRRERPAAPDRTADRRSAGSRRRGRCVSPPPPWRMHGQVAPTAADRAGRGSTRSRPASSPPIVVLVAVGDHDHVTRLGPVPVAVVARDPARAPGDDVEEDQPLGAGVERVGERRSASTRTRTPRSAPSGRRSRLRGAAARARRSSATSGRLGISSGGASVILAAGIRRILIGHRPHSVDRCRAARSDAHETKRCS